MRVRAVGSLAGDEWATATFEKHRSKVNLAAVICRKCSRVQRDSDGKAFALWAPIIRRNEVDQRIFVGVTEVLRNAEHDNGVFGRLGGRKGCFQFGW